MTKATQDDIGSIASRIDAQTIVLIEAMAELSNVNVNPEARVNPEAFSKRYAKRYDTLSAKFREDLVS